MGIEVAIEVDELEGGGVQVDQKCACMYAYGRYPLEAATFAHRRSILFISQHLHFSVWILKAAIDMSVHLQLTPRDSNLLNRTEPCLH